METDKEAQQREQLNKVLKTKFQTSSESFEKTPPLGIFKVKAHLKVIPSNVKKNRSVCEGKDASSETVHVQLQIFKNKETNKQTQKSTDPILKMFLHLILEPRPWLYLSLTF